MSLIDHINKKKHNINNMKIWFELSSFPYINKEKVLEFLIFFI